MQLLGNRTVSNRPSVHRLDGSHAFRKALLRRQLLRYRLALLPLQPLADPILGLQNRLPVDGRARGLQVSSELQIKVIRYSFHV